MKKEERRKTHLFRLYIFSISRMRMIETLFISHHSFRDKLNRSIGYIVCRNLEF